MQIFRIGGIIIQIITFFSINSLFSDIIRYGTGRIFSSGTMIETIITWLIFLGSLGYFLYIAAAAVIFPPGANRMLPVRTCLTAIWAASFAVVLYWSTVLLSFQAFIVWGYMTVFIISVFSMIAVSERDIVTDRVAREIPASSFARRVAMLFYSGAANGIIWILMMFALTLLLTAAAWNLSPGISARTDLGEFITYALGIGGYLIGYSLLAAFLRRTFFGSYIDSRNTWVVAMFVCAVFSMAPLFFGSLIGLDSDTLLIGSPISLGQAKGKEEALVFAILLFTASIVINLPWLTRQIKEFTPVIPETKN
jgi:hypothetical protein